MPTLVYIAGAYLVLGFAAALVLGRMLAINDRGAERQRRLER